MQQKNQNSKRICFVTTISATLQSFVVDTADYLHNNGGYDISFICNPDESFEQTLPEYIHFFPVQMKRGISLEGVKTIFELYKIFKNERFDLVQYSTPNAACYASIAAKAAKINVRLYCQWGIVYVGFTGLKRKLFKMIEKMICNCSTRIEPDSFGNLHFGIDEGLYIANKAGVVWNGSASGVKLSKFDIKYKQKWRNEIREEIGIPQDAFVYGFVGRITRDKGINELFISSQKILDKFPDSWLILVGNPEKLDSVNQQLYEWASGHERVVFCGYTNRVECYLSAMDVYILPSYREGFGSAVVEAEAMGVPVIVTDIPGPTDAMIPNKTGLLVKKKDPLSLANAMEDILVHVDKRNSFGEQGYNFAVNHFNQEILLQHILEDRCKLMN